MPSARTRSAQHGHLNTDVRQQEGRRGAAPRWAGGTPEDEDSESQYQRCRSGAGAVPPGRLDACAIIAVSVVGAGFFVIPIIIDATGGVLSGRPRVRSRGSSSRWAASRARGGSSGSASARRPPSSRWSSCSRWWPPLAVTLPLPLSLTLTLTLTLTMVQMVATVTLPLTQPYPYPYRKP